MSFSRQLSLVLFLVVLCALGARAVLTVHETQDYLSRQLESHARDAARSLGLSISLHLAEGDELFMESVVDSLFDSGDYESIRVIDLDGRPRLVRERERRPHDVPSWFVDRVPIEAPQASAVLTAGWNSAGHVSVRSYPGYAYQQLWDSTVRSALSALVFLILALVVIGLVLRWMLRPLDLIERQARAVADRRFPRIERLPATREFRRVAEAMNFMTGNVEKFIADQSEQARQLRAEAYLDPVTGLRNRRALHMDIDQLAREARQEGPGALMLVNVRGLDAVNRRDGYDSGDAFMRAVAGRLAALAGSHRVVSGRWGGAMFALVLSEASLETVTALATDLVRDLATVEHQGACAEAVNVGVVFHTGTDDAEALVEKCEAALSNAEGEGPGHWHLWQATETVPVPELRDEVHWQSMLKRVIENREVVLEAQPVVGVDGAALHREVLARFRSEDGSLVPAGRFIPVAARLGLSTSLDVVIVEKVLEVLAVRFQSDERLAVNLSAAAAADGDFLRWLSGRLAREPAARRARLCVETSEHFAARNPQAMRSLVDTLRRLGVAVGVDHCGADDVSLGALRELALDYAKVYGAFVSGIDGDRERQHLLRSLVSIGHGMGLVMVAEFVETEAERATVKDLGCDAVQGFLLGRPQAVD
jgi:diguanylate cyclase (GGDEF)-like protein